MYTGDCGSTTLRDGLAELYRRGLSSLHGSIENRYDLPPPVIGFKDLPMDQQLAVLAEVSQALLVREVTIRPSFLRAAAAYRRRVAEWAEVEQARARRAEESAWRHCSQSPLPPSEHVESTGEVPCGVRIDEGHEALYLK